MKMLVQRVKLDMSFVHKIAGVSFYLHLTHNSGIVNRSFCQMDKCRDGAPKIHQGMHLDCSSLMMKLSPWTKLIAVNWVTAGDLMERLSHLLWFTHFLNSYVFIRDITCANIVFLCS